MKLSDIVHLSEADTKKKKKKDPRDKSADIYPSYVAGNVMFRNVCSSDLSGEKKVKESASPLAKWNQLIFEADKPKPTKTQSDEVNMDDIFNTSHFNAPTNRPKSGNVQKKQAGSAKTKQAVSGIQMDQRSNDLLNQLDQSGLEDDRPARARNTTGGIPEPKPPGNEVAVRGQNISKRGTDISTDAAEPNWHKIEDLPGYMKSAVRAIGRKVFEPLTNTDIEDIDVIANLNGSGPNTDEELKLVGSYLKRNGTRQSEAEIDFNQTVLRGYKADVQIWTAGDLEFLTVKDFQGQYIYSWPVSDSKNFNLFKGLKKGIGTERNRLR